VMEALAFWRMHPRQIASDLRRFFHADIEDWHRGCLSSHKLLEWFGVDVEYDHDAGTRTIRVECAPEGGAVDVAIREGGFSRIEHMIAETFNELARVRLWIHVGNGGKEYEPPQFTDPREDRRRREEERRKAEYRQKVANDLFSNFNW